MDMCASRVISVLIFTLILKYPKYPLFPNQAQRKAGNNVVITLTYWFSKCGPQTGTIWELVQNADSQAPPSPCGI